MSYEWNACDFRAGRTVRVPSGLSHSLAQALFGAAISSLPGAAYASEETSTPTATTSVPTATASTGPVIATAAVPSVLPIVDAAVASAAPATTPIALPVAASAEQRSYGPLRPGLGTPANTMAPGQISVETGFLDWQRDDTDGVRTDTVLVGATTVRIGVTRTIEAMAGWTPFGHVRVRDQSGNVEQANRIGDAMLGFKVNLTHPDGSGLSAAIQPLAVLPVGRTPVGVGDWGAGVVAPISYDLSKTVNVALTGEIDAATNSAGKGRHLSFSVVGGVSVAVTSAVKVTGELSSRRDDDPVARSTQGFASVSVAWNARENLQIDLGSAAGFNHDSPALRLYGGISRRF